MGWTHVPELGRRKGLFENKITVCGRTQQNKSNSRHYYIAVYVKYGGMHEFQRAFNLNIYDEESLVNIILEYKEKYGIDKVVLGKTKTIFTDERIIAVLDRFR